MVQAAACGAIDFSTANFLDRNWWLKVNWILNRLEEEHSMSVFLLQHAQHTSVLSYELEKQAFDAHWSSGNNIIKSIRDIQFPWLREKDANDKSKYNGLLEAWKRKFGDINDPAVKAKFDKIGKSYKKQIEARRLKAIENTPPTMQQKLKKVMDKRKNRKR